MTHNAHRPDNATSTPTPIPAAVSSGMMRVSILAELPALLRSLGHDPDRLLAELELDPALLADPENILPFQVTGDVLSHCMLRTGCPHLGLLLGQRGGTATLGLVGLLTRSSPDVGSALRNLIKHLHHHDQGAVLDLSINGNTALLGYAIYEKAVRCSDQIYTGAIAVAFRIMLELCGRGWRPTEVWLPFRKPLDSAPFRQFFRAPLRFEAELGALAFPVAFLKQPLQNANNNILQQIKNELDTHTPLTVTDHARRAMRAMLAQGTVSAGHLAQQFNVSRRTLIRQLHHEGTSFRALVNEMRFKVACQMLQDTDSAIEQIGTSLGYANASSFTRAFKSWTGQAPADWRKVNKSDLPRD